MKQINIRVSEDEKEKIDNIALSKGLTLKELVLASVLAYASFDDSSDDLDEEEKVREDNHASSKLVDVLAGQIAQKDAQIETLTRLLSQEQELNLKNVKRLEEPKKRNFFERFFGD
jgi:uncharacterized protein (DUF1778 family)